MITQTIQDEHVIQSWLLMVVQLPMVSLHLLLVLSVNIMIEIWTLSEEALFSI